MYIDIDIYYIYIDIYIYMYMYMYIYEHMHSLHGSRQGGVSKNACNDMYSCV
jgi:hypothetical protein